MAETSPWIDHEPIPTDSREAIPSPETSLSLSSQAHILIDGRLLTGEDDPRLLTTALSGNLAIPTYFEQARRHFESFRAHDGAKITPPSLIVATLTDEVGKRDSQVVTEEAYVGVKSGIYRDIENLLPKYHPHWQAVLEAGFAPEVRIMGGRAGREAYLFIQPPIEPEA